MEAEVLIRTEGRAGRITLNRPAALNALTPGMVAAIRAALEDWRNEAGVRLVIIDAAGQRAFCAGGDIAELYARGRRGDFDFARDFWRAEYAMNDAIARYPVPVAAFIQGFCMGGGVGVACHAGHRIVGESARIAMPECGIGLVPDVGGSLLLSRAPAGVGPWLALTGARMEPAAAIEAGFADLFIPETRWSEVQAALAETGNPAVLEGFAGPPPSGTPLPTGALRQAFAAPTLSGVAEALSHCAGPEAEQARAAISRGSPLAMATALALQARLRATPDLRTALSLEYRAARRLLKIGDFLEGIRARLIDRDDTPRWRHAGPQAVSDPEVMAMLAPLEGDEMQFADQERTAP